MLSPTEFSADEAQRAKDLREELCECGHEPDEVHVAEDVRMGTVVKAVYGVEGDGEALDTATAVIEDLPEDKVPDTFYYANGRHNEDPEIGPADLGVVWKSLDPADVEREEPLEPADMGTIWKSLTPADFPEAWEDMTAEDGAPGFATLVELMVSHLPEHQLERMRVAVSEECGRREAWDTYTPNRRLEIGRWALFTASKVADESEDLPPGVAETPDEDPRGDA